MATAHEVMPANTMLSRVAICRQVSSEAAWPNPDRTKSNRGVPTLEKLRSCVCKPADVGAASTGTTSTLAPPCVLAAGMPVTRSCGARGTPTASPQLCVPPLKSRVKTWRSVWPFTRVVSTRKGLSSAVGTIDASKTSPTMFRLGTTATVLDPLELCTVYISTMLLLSDPILVHTRRTPPCMPAACSPNRMPLVAGRMFAACHTRPAWMYLACATLLTLVHLASPRSQNRSTSLLLLAVTARRGGPSIRSSTAASRRTGRKAVSLSLVLIPQVARGKGDSTMSTRPSSS